jgi:hypothetical protein
VSVYRQKRLKTRMDKALFALILYLFFEL